MNNHPKFMKKGQIFSTEVYIAIVLFLVALVAFYAIISQKDVSTPIEEEAERIAGNLMIHPYFEDGELSPDDVNEMASWNCTYLKQTFGTIQDICLYAKDEEGNLQSFGGKQFIGCGNITIGDEPCGT